MKRKIVSLLLLMLLAASAFMQACSKPGGGQSAGGAGDPGSLMGEADSAAFIAGLTSDVTADNIAEFDFTGKAMEYLEYIGTKFPDRDCTDSGSDRDAAREWIISELIKAGYQDDQIEEQTFRDGLLKGTNIILTVEGEDPSRQIIAGGHYDGDGAGDNGSGTALLLATAAGLSGQKPHYTVKYIFFDCEEIGLSGSIHYVKKMSDSEAASTVYMINLDALAFGDYCNIYGGDPAGSVGTEGAEGAEVGPAQTGGYDFAADLSEKLGFKVMRTADLDGYFAKQGTGPAIEDKTLYTNPWTDENPSPSNYSVASPATLPASDHVGFMEKGIEYIYFEATNWFAEGANDEVEATSYTGYIETYDYTIGEHGMFMNTEYDTWENLSKYFPGRAKQHYSIYSPLLSALIMVR